MQMKVQVNISKSSTEKIPLPTLAQLNFGCNQNMAGKA